MLEKIDDFLVKYKGRKLKEAAKQVGLGWVGGVS